MDRLFGNAAQKIVWIGYLIVLLMQFYPFLDGNSGNYVDVERCMMTGQCSTFIIFALFATTITVVLALILHTNPKTPATTTKTGDTF